MAGHANVSKMEGRMKEYLFEYHYGGSTWGITIHASGIAEAKEKIKAAGMAAYKGEGVIRIPVEPAWKWPVIVCGAMLVLGLFSYAFR